MLSRAVALFALALPLLAVAVVPCGEGTKPYCCKTNSLTPKGYVGEGCTAMTCEHASCTGGASVMCCENFLAASGTAYYCAAPRTA